MKTYTRKTYRDQLLTYIQASMPTYLKTFTEEEQFRLNALPFMNATQLEGWINKEPRLLDQSAITNFHPTLKTFNALKKWAFDLPVDGLDGVSEDDFFEGLEHGATLLEIKELAKRYELEIPRRIKKEELVEILIKRQVKPADTKAELMKKNTLFLEQYAKDKGIHVAIELKKTDMIAYLADHLKTFKHSPQNSVLKKSPHTSLELPDAALIEVMSRYQFPLKEVAQIIISLIIIAILIGGTYWLMA